MATTERKATCPLCNDYEGDPSSVEAHISANTDPIHLGEVGRAHRDDLRRQVDGGDEIAGSDDHPVDTSDDQPVAGSDDPSTHGGPRTEDRDTTGQDGQDGDSMPTDDELERQRAQYGDDSDDGDLEVEPVEDIDSAGISIPVSSTVLIVAVAALLAVVVWYRAGSPSDSGSDEDGQESQEDESQPSATGLIEGDW